MCKCLTLSLHWSPGLSLCLDVLMNRDLLEPSALQPGVMVGLCLQCRWYLGWFMVPDVLLKAQAVLYIQNHLSWRWPWRSSSPAIFLPSSWLKNPSAPYELHARPLHRQLQLCFGWLWKGSCEQLVCKEQPKVLPCSKLVGFPAGRSGWRGFVFWHYVVIR